MTPGGERPGVAVTAYLGLGSNQGDRSRHLQLALDGLAATEGIEVSGVSGVYETDPVGGPPQPDYLNAVVAVRTSLSARRLLEVAKRLEAMAGRAPGAPRHGPRPLDIDVLLVGGEQVDEEDLCVPHPRLSERHFVLAPLADLAPSLVASPTAGWIGVRRCTVRLSAPETPMTGT